MSEQPVIGVDCGGCSCSRVMLTRTTIPVEMVMDAPSPEEMLAIWRGHVEAVIRTWRQEVRDE